MTKQDFINCLKSLGYTHKVSGSGVSVVQNDYVDLRSLTSIPEGTKFENHGPVDLDNLTSLPENTKFKNHGYVDLRRLVRLPEGTKFENHGYVDLRRLNGDYSYRGAVRKFRNVDGVTMLLDCQKSYGRYDVHSARYFGGGHISDLRKCYVADGDGLTAPGATIKDAIENLEFKINENVNKAEIAQAIVDSGKVTLAQFRAVTGACREGARQHLAQIGIELDAIEVMDISDALKAMSGTSYGDRFAALVGVSE